MYLRQATCYNKAKYQVAEVNVDANFLFSMLLMFTNMYSVAMVTMLFSCKHLYNIIYQRVGGFFALVLLVLGV